MSGLTIDTIASLNPADKDALVATASLLTLSVHESIRGLVPYNASGYTEYLRASLSPPEHFRTLLVRTATADGRPIAAADWRILPSQLFLNGIAVAEPARGIGLAHRLMEDGIRLAQHMGLQEIGLDVNVENSVAMSFYRSAGFVVTGETLWYDVQADSGATKTLPAKGLDWAAFHGSLSAYGFGNLTIRGADGEHQIRQIRRNLRVDSTVPLSDVACYEQTLGTKRTYTTSARETRTIEAFSVSARMLREV